MNRDLHHRTSNLLVWQIPSVADECERIFRNGASLI